MEQYPKKLPPQVDSRLRHSILEMPIEIRKASGIVIYGRRIKSLVFTTDLAIIKNCDADAVFAVYPFTPQQSISDAIIKASYIPVFCGVGGGTTQGLRTVSLAKDAEAQGAMGVVLNAPVSNLNLLAVSKAVDIPVIITVIDEATTLDSGLHPARRFSTSQAGRIPRRLCERFARSTRIFRLLPPAATSRIPSPRRLRQAQTRLRLRRHPHRNCSKR